MTRPGQRRLADVAPRMRLTLAAVTAHGWTVGTVGPDGPAGREDVDVQATQIQACQANGFRSSLFGRRYERRCVHVLASPRAAHGRRPTPSPKRPRSLPRRT